MPISGMGKVPSVIYSVELLDPKSILEIGCGFGKYGALLRERLDVREGRVSPDSWCIKLDACEIFPNYRSPLWQCYDDIVIADIRDIVKDIKDYDVILMTDVIEHFSKNDGQELIRNLILKCKALVLTTPSKFFPQEDWGGNEAERHLSLWTRDDFKEFHSCVINVSGEDLLVIIVSLQSHLQKIKYRQYPFVTLKRVTPVYRDLKRIFKRLPQILLYTSRMIIDYSLSFISKYRIKVQ